MTLVSLGGELMVCPHVLVSDSKWRLCERRRLIGFYMGIIGASDLRLATSMTFSEVRVLHHEDWVVCD